MKIFMSKNSLLLTFLAFHHSFIRKEFLLIHQKGILLVLFHIFTEFSFLAFVTSLRKGRRRAHPKDPIWILAPPAVPLSFCLLQLSPHWKRPFGSASNFSSFVSRFHRFLFGNLLPEPSVCSSSEPTGHPVQGEPLLSASLGLCCVAYVQLEEAKDQTRSVRSVHVARAAWLLRVAWSPLYFLSPPPQFLFLWHPTCETRMNKKLAKGS